MNLIEEQQFLIKEIFQVRLHHQQSGESLVSLTQFPKDIQNLGNNISLLQHKAYFDSLLMQRLQVPQTEIIFYLYQCISRCNYLIDKPWNQSQSLQQFIKYSIEIIKNFVYLGFVQSQIFPEQQILDSDAEKCTDKMLAISMKLVTHFEQRGFDFQIFNIIYPKIEDQENGNKFLEAFIEVILARLRFQTILDSKLLIYLGIFKNLLSNEKFKMKFLNLSRTPFIPDKNGIKNIKGNSLDMASAFGLIARPSLLGTSATYNQQIKANMNLAEKIFSDFDKAKYKKDYEARLKYYHTAERQYLNNLNQIFKVMLKKDSQKIFFQWIYCVIVGNLKKSKLGSRLQGVEIPFVSHDGFVINIFMCLLELCQPIIDKSKNRYQSIDPQYFIYNQRSSLCKYEPLYKKSEQKGKMEIQGKQFGTITIFFFSALELFNISIVPSLNTLQQTYKEQERIAKQLKQFEKVDKSNFMVQKIQKQLMRLKTKMHQYYLQLIDDTKIKGIIKLLDMLLFLFPKWLKIDFKNLKKTHYKRPLLLSYLPQHLLNNIVEFHKTYIRFKQHYINFIGQQHLNSIVNITCLLLSQLQISSNPYICANFVELLFYFVDGSKNNPLPEILKNNQIAIQNITFGLVRFHVEIARTGSSHQFYSKYNYRFYVNKIFTTLWKYQVYRNSLKSISKTEEFQRFVSGVMTDATYCFDQTAEKYEKIKQYQMKRQNNSMTKQDYVSQQQISNQMAANLMNSTSNIKLLRNLSSWSPQTFHTEAFITSAVPLFNNILKTLVDPTSFVANREICAKYDFNKAFVLSDILSIYVNLNINNAFISEIIRDQRYYKRQYFTTALQRATNDNCADIEVLQKFEELINQLSNAKKQDEDDDEIFGQIPENYLCSLIGSLLKDPVLLPTSNHVVDRMYIHKHLLNDERDPFNRKPLKYSEVVQQPKLKNQIEQWKKKRLEELRNADKQAKYGKKGEKKIQEEKQEIFKQKIFED